jgi:hypothetical protein
MIWFDLVTPKSVMFFKNIIKMLEIKGKEVFVTAREGFGYTEIVELLRLHDIAFHTIGEFGGAKLEDKLKASIDRQFALMEFIRDKNVEKLVCLCSVDANRVAFGLGIPIYNFYDIPLSDCTANFKKALPQARLTLPLSAKAFRPYMVPSEIFERFSLEKDQIFEYHFLDVLVWLAEFCADKRYFDNVLNEYGLDPKKQTIVVREEEYKASYVMKKFPILYQGLEILKDKLDANIIAIPRYEPEPLQELLPFATVLKEKMIVQHLLAFADLFIGGGGTLNSEACYFGTPTISTRSFVSHYDKLLIDEGLMQKADTVDELVALCIEHFSKRTDAKRVFDKMNLDLVKLVEEIIL